MAQSIDTGSATHQLDWTAHESTIRRLYVEENMPLEGHGGVIDTMRRLHQFSATYVSPYREQAPSLHSPGKLSTSSGSESGRSPRTARALTGEQSPRRFAAGRQSERRASSSIKDECCSSPKFKDRSLA